MSGKAGAQKRRREEREPEILAAAREMLEAQGLVGTSVAQVAARAGVSEATVFNYFPTRRDLMFRVIADWMTPVIEQLRLDLRHVQGVQARLAMFCDRHLQETAAAPGLHRLIYRELHWENYYGSTLHRLNQSYTGLVEWILIEGRAAGEVRVDAEIPITRDMLFGALHHVGWRTLLNERSLDVPETADQIAGQIFRAVAAMPTAENASLDPVAAVVARLERVADRLERPA
jgi:AcrR family transcriptional regulator